MAWEYQELLNQNIQILLLLALGAGSVFLKIFRQSTDLRTLNAFVFMILLPASVLLGLGLRSNLRDGATWRFVGAWLMMRAICLAANSILFFRQGVGIVSANWLFVSWASTVILGVPLVRAALGPQYANLGVVAGISSFIFQLPLMLVLFEVHENRRRCSKTDQGEQTTTSPDGTIALPETTTDFNKNHEEEERNSISQFWLTRQQLKAVGLQLLKNPILWAILIGLILSVTTLGPKYLSPGTPPLQPNCNYVIETGFIQLLLTNLAACTEPVALFATGIFLYHKNPLACGWMKAAMYMVVKLIIVPAVMVGCAFAVGLEGAPARAAVVIASLPISAAAFTLCDRYDVLQKEAVSNIFFGNLLVLPTTLAWIAFMDAVELFPVVKTAMPNVCASPPPAAAPAVG